MKPSLTGRLKYSLCCQTYPASPVRYFEAVFLSVSITFSVDAEWILECSRAVQEDKIYKIIGKPNIELVQSCLRLRLKSGFSSKNDQILVDCKAVEQLLETEWSAAGKVLKGRLYTHLGMCTHRQWIINTHTLKCIICSIRQWCQDPMVFPSVLQPDVFFCSRQSQKKRSKPKLSLPLTLKSTGTGSKASWRLAQTNIKTHYNTHDSLILFTVLEIS